MGHALSSGSVLSVVCDCWMMLCSNDDPGPLSLIPD